jgi:cytoskeletal protein CcmA (bactofilin family)
MESSMAEVRIKDIDEHEVDTILAEDIDFEGHLTFKKPLMIKGKFKGEIKSTSALYIGEKALVEAKTEAAVVSSRGAHKGDIVGHSRVELFSTAQVDGDISTPDFVMESGCKFNGYCNMGGPARKDAQPQAAAHAPQAQPQVQPQTQPAAQPQPQAQPQVQNPAQNQHPPQNAPQGPQHPPQQNQPQNQNSQAPQNQNPQNPQRPGGPSSGSGGQQR